MLSRPATGGQPGAESATHTAPRLDSQHPHAMSSRRQVRLGRGRGVGVWGGGRGRGRGGKAHNDRMPIYHDVVHMYESTNAWMPCSIPARPSNATGYRDVVCMCESTTVLSLDTTTLCHVSEDYGIPGKLYTAARPIALHSHILLPTA
jgi:hypothetical protein